MLAQSSILSFFAAIKIRNQYLLNCFIIISLSCNNPQKSSENTGLSVDTVVRTFIITKGRLTDSTDTQQQRDSLYAIKPLAIFTSDSGGDAYQKMYALFTDTSRTIQTPLSFSEKTTYAYNKEQIPVTQTITYTSKRFVVKIFSPSLAHKSQYSHPEYPQIKKQLTQLLYQPTA